MLYTQAKAYLVGKLKEAGLKTKPYTTMKSLSRSMESHVGAVLPGTEMVARNGSKPSIKTKRERSTSGERSSTGT